MTLKDLSDELKTLGLPVAYDSFKRDYEPDLPFIVYYKTNEETFQADNKNYLSYSDIAIEVYSDFKNEDLERQVEEILNRNELIFRSVETYWEEDYLYEVLYETRIFH